MSSGSTGRPRAARACEKVHKLEFQLSPDPIEDRIRRADTSARACEKFHKLANALPFTGRASESDFATNTNSRTQRGATTVASGFPDETAGSRRGERSVLLIARLTEGPRPIPSRELTRTYSGADEPGSGRRPVVIRRQQPASVGRRCPGTQNTQTEFD